MKTILLLFVCLAAGLFGQTASSYPAPLLNTSWHQALGAVPTSTTAVTIIDSTIDRIVIQNPSSSTNNTCTVTDAASNNIMVITFTGQANVSQDMGGVYATGGVKWSCTQAATGWMRGKYVGR